MKAVFEEEERNNKKGAKANTGSAAKPIVNHQIDSDEAVLKIHLEKKLTMISKCNNCETLMQGVQKNVLTECCRSHGAQAQSTVHCSGWPHLGLESVFGCFLLRISRIKRAQVMLMGKFYPTALNFG